MFRGKWLESSSRTSTGESKAPSLDRCKAKRCSFNFTSRPWDEENDVLAGEEQLSISTELLPVLTLYSALLNAMSSTLSALPLQTAYRKTSNNISEYLYGRLTSKVFSQTGGERLRLDLESGWIKAARDAGVRRPDAGWKKLRDAATVLSLPAGKVESGKVSFSEAMGAAWDDSGVKYDALRGKLDVELEQSQMRSLLRKRPECWKAGGD